VKPTLAAFLDLQNLSPNWDSYGAKTINQEMIRASLMILTQIMQADSPVPSIVPLSDGGIQIEWHRRQQDLEIVFSMDDQPQYFYRSRDGLEAGPVREIRTLTRLLQQLA
jgi:hypothetical protein